MLGLKIYVKIFLGERFHLGGRRSDNGIWSWSDGSAWSYENFQDEELRNRLHILVLNCEKKWVGGDDNWNDNYLCQYTL